MRSTNADPLKAWKNFANKKITIDETKRKKLFFLKFELIKRYRDSLKYTLKKSHISNLKIFERYTKLLIDDHREKFDAQCDQSSALDEQLPPTDIISLLPEEDQKVLAQDEKLKKICIDLNDFMNKNIESSQT
jgi:hypothetical protein